MSQAVKRELRALARARREAMFAADRADASRRIVDKILTHPSFLAAGRVMAYVTMRGEVDTAALIGATLAAGKTVAVPACDWDTRTIAPVRLTSRTRLVTGRHGVPEPDLEQREPIAVDTLDLVLVPGVAFSPAGWRLGYGAGMYDRFLASLPPQTLCWGLAFDVQVLDNVPSEAHDRPVDAVITESRWLERDRADA